MSRFGGVSQDVPQNKTPQNSIESWDVRSNSPPPKSAQSQSIVSGARSGRSRWEQVAGYDRDLRLVRHYYAAFFC